MFPLENHDWLLGKYTLELELDDDDEKEYDDSGSVTLPCRLHLVYY